MPRHPKGPRLRLRSSRVHSRTGKPLAAVFYIRDGQDEISTGFGPERAGDAQAALANYILAQRSGGAPLGPTRPDDPSTVLVAEVIALYAQEKAPKSPDPSTVRARLSALLGWWGDKTLSDVKRSTSEAYVAYRQTQPRASFKDATAAPKVTVEAARRELEDLSAAIGYWDAEYHLTRRPKVVLPEKRASSRDALTRDQVARLLKAARGYRRRECYGPWREGEPPQYRWRRLPRSSRANRRHIARFILLGLYTGTRPGVIPKLLWSESASQAWIDLENGVVHRRGRAEHDHRTKRRPMVRLPRRLLSHARRWLVADLRLAIAKRERAKRLGLPETFEITTVIHHGGLPLAGRIRRSFASVVADAGLDADITPHWMRHTCATWLMEADVPLWEAASYTGMTTATLEKHYGHHRHDHHKQARDAFSPRR